MATAARLWVPVLGLALSLLPSLASGATTESSESVLPATIAANGSTLLITDFRGDTAISAAPSPSLAGALPEPASAGVLILGVAALATRFSRARRAIQ